MASLSRSPVRQRGAFSGLFTGSPLQISRRLARSVPVAVAVYLVIVYAIIQAALTGAEAMGYNWQWYRIPDYFYRLTDDGFEIGEIMLGLGKTIALSTQAFLLAVLIGLIVALLRLSGLFIGTRVAIVYLEFIRNMPLLVLLYVFYYVLGPIFDLNRYIASILCLGVFHSALISEIFRAGINAVHTGQWEAAKSIGMSTTQSYRYIILPQSIKFMLPPMTGEVVHMIKSSAIVSVIAVAELTTIGRNIIADTYMSFEIWFTIAAVYMVVTLALSVVVTFVEKRYAVIT
ncbi:MAG: amino acid ABC transporter permease [Rhodobacteraceae bacterium]|nr:amino acid ABC transporter permease [Paracoccaceae bacterium]